MSKILIRNIKGAEDRVSSGANMEILIDGKVVEGVTFAKFEVKAGGVAKIELEMFASVEVDANIKSETMEIKNG